MQVFEYTYTRRRVSESPATIRSPQDVFEVVRNSAHRLLEDRETEALLVFALDTKNHVIGVEQVYSGNVSASLVRVGEAFRFAVRVNATSIILVHNHPSGDSTPSPDDMHLTAECLAAGRLLDIALLDHIVVTESGHSSLRDRGVAFS